MLPNTDSSLENRRGLSRDHTPQLGIQTFQVPAFLVSLYVESPSFSFTQVVPSAMNPWTLTLR